MIGQVVGQYRIIEKLGEGGMGAVYKGIDLMVEREVAIKMLRPEIARQPELVERFRSEAITLAKLNYPGIATLYNFFRQGDDFFMVMEFVSGRTLESIIRESGAMPWERAVPLFCRILEAIQPAHQSGILHRDIKPSNIMLTSWGGVKVMDFGIARVLGAARLTREGRMVGTIEYIAPERIRGDESDVRADIYSLGIVLYEMLTGRLPFESTSEFEIMRGHVQDEPPPFHKFCQNFPESIETVVMQALGKTADNRIQSCSAFLMALQNATQGLTPSTTLPQFPAPEPARPAGSPPPPNYTQAMDYPTSSRLDTGSTGSPVAGAYAATGEVKATRFEPQPVFTPTPQTWSQTGPVGMPAAATPVSNQYAQPGIPSAPGPNAVSKQPGFLANMTWKHYAGAGGAVLVLIVLVALLTLGRSKPPVVEEKTTANPAADSKPSPVSPPSPEPALTPAAVPAQPVGQPDSLPKPGSNDAENERTAKTKDAVKKRAEALKALDEPQ